MSPHRRWHVAAKPPTDGRTQEERDLRKEIRQRVQYALMMIVALLATYAAWQARETGNRVTRDEHSTCVIQKRGLPAGHQLADAMTDIHELLSVLLLLPPASPARPVSKTDRQRAVPTGATGSSGLTGTAGAVLRGFAVDLNDHLSQYLAAESEQPGTRTCS